MITYDLKTLEQAISEQDLNTLIQNVYNSDLLVKRNLSTDEYKLNDFTLYLAHTIMSHYFDCKIAYNDEEMFKKRLGNEIGYNFNYLYKKYLVLDKLYSELETLTTLSKTTIDSEGKAINVGGNTQRQASTPTIVSAPNNTITFTTPSLDGDGEKTSTIVHGGYTDKYTNFAGASSSVAEGKDKRTTTTDREGSTRELMDNIDRLTRSLSTEIIRLISKHFIFLIDNITYGG